MSGMPWSNQVLRYNMLVPSKMSDSVGKTDGPGRLVECEKYCSSVARRGRGRGRGRGRNEGSGPADKLAWLHALFASVDCLVTVVDTIGTRPDPDPRYDWS